jgi:hypothetical protein
VASAGYLKAIAKKRIYIPPTYTKIYIIIIYFFKEKRKKINK